MKMLEIKPNLDKQVILSFCKKCRLVYSDAFYAYQAQDGGEILATALFLVNSTQVEAVYYETALPEDHFLFDTMLRAGLNYADNHDIPTGHIPEAFRQEHGALFDRLNFPPETTFVITNFFSRYKNCRSYFA